MPSVVTPKHKNKKGRERAARNKRTDDKSSVFASMKGGQVRRQGTGKKMICTLPTITMREVK